MHPVNWMCRGSYFSEIRLPKKDKWLKKISAKQPLLKLTMTMAVEVKNRVVLSHPLLAQAFDQPPQETETTVI